MLPTCTRCRSRRIKCDSCLPACANCAKSDSVCTSRDDALQEDIPRSYIQALNERIEGLRSQLALFTAQTSPHGATTDSSPQLSLSPHHRPLHILAPVRSGSDLRLDFSFPSCVAKTVFEALSLIRKPLDLENDFSDDGYFLGPELSTTDRSQLTPSIIRFLLTRYNRCIKPIYGLEVSESSSSDVSSFEKLTHPQKFNILMACAIAASVEALRKPTWKLLANSCREWAAELINPIISFGDGNAVAALLFLLIYELTDPSRSLTWEVLDLATRTCLQLGWHQIPAVEVQGQSSTFERDKDEAIVCGLDKIQMMTLLKDIEGSLQPIFHRPNMLRQAKIPTTSETESIVDLHIRIFNQIFGKAGMYERQACPLNEENTKLMSVLATYHGQHSITHETWLLYLPVCSNHRQCLDCFQEADEPYVMGMRTLRHQVVTAASKLIADVHRIATSQDGFIPPIIASSRAFVAGCSIITSILKRWTNAQDHVTDLMRCTDVLNTFAPHWKGGFNYLKVWRDVIVLLDLKNI